MPLKPHALGLAFGLLWGGGMLVVGLTAAYASYGVAIVEVMSSIYVGFVATPAGAIAGAIWGFIDGYIAGALAGWLYNRFV